MASLIPFLSVYLKTKNLTPFEVGVILSVKPFTVFAGTTVLSTLADRYDAHKVHVGAPPLIAPSSLTLLRLFASLQDHPHNDVCDKFCYTHAYNVGREFLGPFSRRSCRVRPLLL